MKSETRRGSNEAERYRRALPDLVEMVLRILETRRRKSMPAPGEQEGQRPQTPEEVSA